MGNVPTTIVLGEANDINVQNDFGGNIIGNLNDEGWNVPIASNS